ncbi:MAG: hypothetical protein DME49_12375 [Verrucomicrobia bacterium]|nr:MAG: hypothetical protein DME49_12375 [Verrucomicrobiota bacterium]PYK94684.1 MAG: hypothetical protein DME36_04725 [Verrucomicrobiota bacterium]PYL37350.1 MAG: hypothetical protein DMF34_10735 [Verrucomicrobiota bacterium]PYL56654.1 MAG: hypothetical protein DMF30_09080 [Verrucomicrobiota bacterium]
MRLILRCPQLTAKQKNFQRAKSRCHFQLATYFSDRDKPSEASFHLVPHSGTKSAGEAGKIDNLTTAR